MRIDLPWPPKGLSPNNQKGRSWKSFTTIRKRYRHECAMLSMGKTVEQGKNIHLTIIFYPPDNRRRDLDNCHAAIKSGLDGMASALGVDDRVFRPITLDFGEKIEGGKVSVFF